MTTILSAAIAATFIFSASAMAQIAPQAGYVQPFTAAEEAWMNRASDPSVSSGASAPLSVFGRGPR